MSHQLVLLVRVGPQGLLCLLIPNSENASLHINVSRKLVCSVKDVFVCIRIKYSLWMNLALTRDMGRINEANCIFSIWTPPGGGLIGTSSCIWMRQIFDIWQAGDENGYYMQIFHLKLLTCANNLCIVLCIFALNLYATSWVKISLCVGVNAQQENWRWLLGGQGHGLKKWKSELIVSLVLVRSADLLCHPAGGSRQAGRSGSWLTQISLELIVESSM